VATLSEYRADVRRLLQDPQARTWSDLDLTAYINRAVQQRDLDLKIRRSIWRFTLTQLQSRYSLSQITTSGTLVTGPSTGTIMDVLSAVLIVSGQAPGGYRAPMSRRPYSWISVWLSTAWPYYPAFYALLPDGTLFLAPPPAQAYQTEWDLVTTTPPLAQDTDNDGFSYPWTDPVPFLAAHFAKVQAQRFDEAGAFLQLYQQRIQMVRTESRALQVPNPWADLWSVRRR
jgi:hypothetical protein